MSKGTKEFKKTIQNYLEDRAENDKLFRIAYTNNKRIELCVYVKPAGIAHILPIYSGNIIGVVYLVRRLELSY